jgi:hypothetical protein
MSNKVLKIIIFAVAILDCLLALVFSFGFNNDKKDQFVQVRTIEAQNPQMVDELLAATPENLSAWVDSNSETIQKSNTESKAAQMQKDILFTYLSELKRITTEEALADYKAKFPEHSASLFAKADKKDDYIQGFANVNNLKDLEGYINKLEKEYDVVKQDFLVERNYLKAANGLVSTAATINDNPSANKKATDLAGLQDDLRSFRKSATLQNVFIILAYCLALVTVLLLLTFALLKIVKNFRSSYKILVVLALAAVVVLIGYLIGSSTLTPVALKNGMTASGFKMVNAAAFTLYVALFAAILSIIVTSIMNAVKNRN